MWLFFLHFTDHVRSLDQLLRVHVASSDSSKRHRFRRIDHDRVRHVEGRPRHERHHASNDSCGHQHLRVADL